MRKKDDIIAEKEEIIAEKEKILIEEKKRAEEEIRKNLELQRQIEALKKTNQAIVNPSISVSIIIPDSEFLQNYLIVLPPFKGEDTTASRWL